MKEKSMLEKEISMTKFLSLFYGINPAQARLISHSDLKLLISDLEVMTEREFFNQKSLEDLINYIKVKDKDNKIRYYKKPKINERNEIYECTDYEFSCKTEIDYLIIPLQNIDLELLDKRELCELRKKLKKIKKLNRNLLDEEINAVQKRLRKLKKEGL